MNLHGPNLFHNCEQCSTPTVPAKGFQPSASSFWEEPQERGGASQVLSMYPAGRALVGASRAAKRAEQAEARAVRMNALQFALQSAEADPDGRVCPLCFHFHKSDAPAAQVRAAPRAPEAAKPAPAEPAPLEPAPLKPAEAEFIQPDPDGPRIKLGRG